MLRLKELRENKGITQKDFAKLFNVAQNTVSNWENGNRLIDIDSATEISNFFEVSLDYFYGRSPKSKACLIPVLGEVRGGVPIEVIEDILDYEEITPEMAHKGEHFGLRVCGDSMEPKFSPGDVVIVRKQPDVDSGDYAVVFVDGHLATVKKIIKKGTSLMLVPLNNNYEPTIYTDKEIIEKPVTILGKVVELRAKFN